MAHVGEHLAAGWVAGPVRLGIVTAALASDAQNERSAGRAGRQCAYERHSVMGGLRRRMSMRTRSSLRAKGPSLKWERFPEIYTPDRRRRKIDRLKVPRDLCSPSPLLLR